MLNEKQILGIGDQGTHRPIVYLISNLKVSKVLEVF